MGCDEARFWIEPQVQVNLLAFVVRDDAVDFVHMWLEWCCDPKAMTDQENVCGLPNLEGFKEHRWQQSIFSLLRQARGIPTFEDPLDIYSEYYEGERV